MRTRLTNKELTLELERLKRRVGCCCPDAVFGVVDAPPVAPPEEGAATVVIDPATGIIYYWDGDSWEIAGPDLIVSADADNDITVGTDFGAYLDISDELGIDAIGGDPQQFLNEQGNFVTVVDTNFGNTDLTLTGNRTHDGATFDWSLLGVTGGGINWSIGTVSGQTDIVSGDGAESSVLQINPQNISLAVADALNLSNVIVGPAGIQLNQDSGQYIIGDGAGAGLPATSAATWILGTDANGNFVKNAVGDFGDVLLGGNTEGAAITIGTNDDFDLNFETSGVERVSISGGTGIGGIVTVTNVTASTNSTQHVVSIRANSTGTPDSGFGPGLRFVGKSDTTDNRNMAQIDSNWVIAADATRQSRISFRTVDSSSTLSERAVLGATFLSFNAALFTIGASSNQITLGGSSGAVNVGNSSGLINIVTSSVSGITVTSSAANAGTTFGVTAFSTTGLVRETVRFTDTYTVASGAGTFTALAIDNTFNLTGTASGIQRGIDINPTLTSLTAAFYRGVDIQYSNARAHGIYQSGANTLNVFVGKTSFGMTTDASGAYIDIAAGTTSLAQINLTPGTAKTTPVAGDVFNVNNNTYVSTGAETFGVGGVIFDNFADSTVGGAVADIYSYTTPASTFGNNGDKVVATYAGNFVTAGTELVQLKVLFAGTTIWDSTGIAVTAGTTSWEVNAKLIRVSSTTVRYAVSLSTTGASGFVYSTVGELAGLTLSSTNILKITGESSGAGSGSGDIVGKMAYGEFKPAR